MKFVTLKTVNCGVIYSLDWTRVIYKIWTPQPFFSFQWKRGKNMHNAYWS